MSHDQKTKQAFEHTAKMEKQARAEAHEEDALNEAVLKADNHTGQQGMMPLDKERGTRLKQGDVYCDLRFVERGELVAHGEEEVHDELLVPKHSVDYEIWNKLIGKPNLAG